MSKPLTNPEIKQLYSQLITQGVEGFSAIELLRALLQADDALSERLLKRYGGLHELAQTTASELAKTQDLSATQIMRLVSALEIGKRAAAYREGEQPQIQTAHDAACLVQDMAHLRQEQARVILLDNQRCVVAIPTVYIGTVNTTVLRVAEVYREAITRNCPAIILVHNHAAGDHQPSPEDVDLTRTLIAAGNLLDIQLLDHLIVSQYGWVSLKEMGLAFR
jgi:DNA repair protein RadC